jgi:hypothetical protein
MLRARLLRDGAPGAEPNGTTGGGVATDPPATGDDQLGEGGKSAIEKERAAAREEKRARTAAEQRAQAAESELEKLRADSQTEAEKATAKAVKEATAAVTQAGNARLVRAEVKAAAAAAQFHDPGDAAALLAGKFAEVKVSDDGSVDEDAVKTLVEGLAKAKPHLVKTAGGGAKPLPGQGTPTTGQVSGKDAGLAEARRRFGEPKTT